MPALLRDAAKDYGTGNERVSVFRDLNLSIEPGQTIALMGPNGCGKSTVARVLLGLESLEQGEVGVVMREADLAAAVLQDYRTQLMPWLTVLENAVLPVGGPHDPGLGEAGFYRAVEQNLEALDFRLPGHARTGSLSGGEQQALTLARAMVFSPSLWVIDEGLSAIDYRRRQLAYNVLRSFVLGRSTLLITHDLDEALALADRLVLFDVGMAILGDWSFTRERDSGVSLRGAEAVRALVRESIQIQAPGRHMEGAPL